MRRGGVVATMIAAVFVGLLAGVVLFTQVGPVPLAIGQPTGGPSGPGSTPPPSPSASPSTPVPTPSSPKPSKPTPSDPAFTVKALLQPEEFETIGTWGPTSLANSWEGLPPQQVSSCTEPADADGKQVAAHSAVYRGESTTAVEVVIRYADAETAREAVTALIERIVACEDQPEGDPDLTVTDLQAPDPAELSEVYLWDTTGTKNSTAQGAIGIARAGDRVAFLTMISLTTDPVGTKSKEGTTRLGPLLLQAGRRLV